MPSRLELVREPLSPIKCAKNSDVVDGFCARGATGQVERAAQRELSAHRAKRAAPNLAELEVVAKRNQDSEKERRSRHERDYTESAVECHHD